MAQDANPRGSGLLGRLSTPLKQAASLIGSTVGLKARGQGAGSSGHPSPESAGEQQHTRERARASPSRPPLLSSTLCHHIWRIGLILAHLSAPRSRPGEPIPAAGAAAGAAAGGALQ